MAKSHLCAVEMEKVHQLHRLAFAQRRKVYPLRLVVQFQLDREYFDMLCRFFSSDLQGSPRRCSSRKYGSVVVLFMPELAGAAAVGAGGVKLAKRLRKSKASWSTCSRRGRIFN